MKLHQIRAFVAALDHGSFSEAGLELGVSQASVSAAVAALERELELRLLDRGRFGAEATAAGARLAGHARSLLRSEQVLRQEAALARGAIEGILRVATYPSAARVLMPELMARMRTRYPALAVRLQVIDDNAGLEAALRGARADVALVLDHHADDLMGWKVFPDPYEALVAPAFHPPGREVVGAAELARWPLILHRDNQCEPHLDRYLASLGIDKEPVQRLNDSQVQVELVGRGLGVAFLTPMTGVALPDGVVTLPLEVPLHRTFLATIVPASLKLPAVRIFLSMLRERFPESEIPPLGLAGAESPRRARGNADIPVVSKNPQRRNS